MIRVIVFDLGGVLINVDYNKTLEAFRLIGATNPEQIYTQTEQADYVDQFERGKINASEFRLLLRKHLIGLHENVTDEEIDTAWNAMVLDFKPGQLEFVKELRDKGYVTCLFSNINPIHCQAVLKAAEHAHLLTLFRESFNEIYLSHKFGYNKPSAESFRRIADDLLIKYGIIPSEILFIDDSAKHIYGRTDHPDEGAYIAGWHGLWVSSNLSANKLRNAIITKLLEINTHPYEAFHSNEVCTLPKPERVNLLSKL